MVEKERNYEEVAGLLEEKKLMPAIVVVVPAEDWLEIGMETVRVTVMVKLNWEVQRKRVLVVAPVTRMEKGLTWQHLNTTTVLCVLIEGLMFHVIFASRLGLGTLDTMWWCIACWGHMLKFGP